MPTTNSNGVPVYTCKVVNTYPHDRNAFTQGHDRNAFTQGLVYEDNISYEGTGLRGRFTLRKVELQTGDILQIHKLLPQFFGEGITIYGNRIIQLTWQSNAGLVYDKYSFKLLQKFNYPTDGGVLRMMENA